LIIYFREEATMSSYAKLQAQIEQLQKEADSIRGRERIETIANIKKAIALFDLTAAELGLSAKGAKGAKASKGAKKADGKAAGAKRRGRPAKAGAKKAGAKKAGRPPKAADGTSAAGKTGKKAGKNVGKAGKKGRPASGAKKSKSNADGRSQVAPKYRDSATGVTWTGRGKQPKWVVAAIAGGKTLADLKI